MTTETTSYSYSELKRAYKEAYNAGDPWGSNISALFNVSAELWHRGAHIPWEYSPGMASDPREPDDYLYEACAGASDANLLRFGAVLNRFDEYLRFKELNY